MSNILTITEHEKIKIAEERDIINRIISKRDKALLLEVTHKNRLGNIVNVFSSFKNTIQAKSIVGSISIKSGLTIEILPKFAKEELEKTSIKRHRKILLNMIRVSKEKNFISSTTQSSKISIGEMPLIRYMIELFSESLLLSLRNGMNTNYNKRVENSSYIRGNVLLTKTIQNNFIDKSKVYISYNQHSANSLLMQIFKTLSQLLLNDTNLSYRAKQYLYEAYILLDNVEVIPLKQHYFDKVIFNRLNDKYEILLRQAEFIFNQYMPFTSNINSTPFWAILFDMNYLFEKFCAYLFRKSDIDIEEQSIVNSFKSTNKIVSAKPDFIIKSQIDLFNIVSISVVDAKWKLLTHDKSLYGLNAQNFWQLFSYMNVINHDEEIHGYFIVPKNSDEFDDEIVFESIIEGNKSITILSINFSLEFEEILSRYQFHLENGSLKINSQDKEKLEVESKIIEDKKSKIILENIKEEEFKFNFEDFIKELEILHNHRNIRKKLSSTKKDTKFKNLYYLKESYHANSSAFKNSVKENLSKISWDLTNLKIDTIPSNISKLKNIEFLNLSDNQIRYLPIEFFRLKKLILLDISNNHFELILSSKFLELNKLRKLIIDKNIVKSNIEILEQLNKNGIKIEDKKGNKLIEDIYSIIKEKKNEKLIVNPIKPITNENYNTLTKEEKQKFIDESDFSLVSKDIIYLIMNETDIDILEDFTYNQTLYLRFAFATYNNNLDREKNEVVRLKENLLKRKNKVLKEILELNIYLVERYIENHFSLIDKEILLGYAMSHIDKLQRVREKISKLTIDIDILNELSKNKDDEKVLENIIFKNTKHKAFQNTTTIYSTIILDRIAHYNFDNKLFFIQKLARNYSLTNETKEYLFEKYKENKSILENLSQNRCQWELQNKIDNKLYGEKRKSYFDTGFNKIDFKKV